MAILDFMTANFELYKDIFKGIPLVRALGGKGAQESWFRFKHHFFQPQNGYIPKSKKSDTGGRRQPG